MTKIDSLEKSSEYGKTAITLMMKFGISATPENYRVWYTYASGQNHNLTRAINIVIDNKHEFSEEICTELVEQFFEESDVFTAFDHASESLQGEINRLIEILGTAGEDTGRFSETLEGFAAGIKPDQNDHDVGILLENVLRETQSMLSKNQWLEAEVNASSKEIQVLRDNLNEAQREALTDKLTGVANRRNFENQLRDFTLRAMETGDPLCLIMADVDYFKKINDSWGHQLGDQVLRLIGMMLKKITPSNGLAARYGGEEFAILLPGCTIEKAIQFAESVRLLISQKKLKKRNSGETIGRITLSFGVACFIPGETLSDFVQRSDASLYFAKQSGRNQVKNEQDLDSELSLIGETIVNIGHDVDIAHH